MTVLKHCLAALGLLAYSSYCYCDNTDTVYGSTQNAASNGLTWTMTNVLPQQTGLTVNGVVYRYTTEKNREDPFVVSIQNENALGEGYIFRQSDDWSGLPGNTIKRVVPVNNIDISYWGDGSIVSQGFGTVKNPSVVYTYRYDPCFDPQSNPSCPGYKDPFTMPDIAPVEIVDPLDDDLIQDELDRKAVVDNDDQEDRDRKKMKSKKKLDKRLEQVLGVVNTSLLAADSAAKHAELMMLAQIPASYTAAQLSGGSYEDTAVLQDKKLPENRKGLRNNLAQQIKHQEMVNLQYDNLQK